MDSSNSDRVVHGVDDGLQGIGFAHGSFFKGGGQFIRADFGWVRHVFRPFDLMDQRFSMGSLKKSANELGYSKDFIAQLDNAQAKTIERLRALRQGPATPKAVTPDSQDTVKPSRSRK